MNKLQWHNRGLSVAVIYVHRKVDQHRRLVQKRLGKTFRKRRPAAHAQGSGEAGLEQNDAGAAADTGDGAGAGREGVTVQEEDVVVRLADPVEKGPVGGLSEVLDDDTGSMLHRVGELIDELLGDQLVHPYATIRKSLARKASNHGVQLQRHLALQYCTVYVRMLYRSIVGPAGPGFEVFVF